MKKPRKPTYKDMRECFAMSQYEWSVLVGMGRMSWNHIEVKRREPTLKQLEDMKPYALLFDGLKNEKPDKGVADTDRYDAQLSFYIRHEYIRLKEQLRVAREELELSEERYDSAVRLASRLVRRMNESAFLPPLTFELLLNKQKNRIESNSPKARARIQLRIAGLVGQLKWMERTYAGISNT